MPEEKTTPLVFDDAVITHGDKSFVGKVYIISEHPVESPLGETYRGIYVTENQTAWFVYGIDHHALRMFTLDEGRNRTFATPFGWIEWSSANEELANTQKEITETLQRIAEASENARRLVLEDGNLPYMHSYEGADYNHDMTDPSVITIHTLVEQLSRLQADCLRYQALCDAKTKSYAEEIYRLLGGK